MAYLSRWKTLSSSVEIRDSSWKADEAQTSIPLSLFLNKKPSPPLKQHKWQHELPEARVIHMLQPPTILPAPNSKSQTSTAS